jgi:mannose-6-phosphate isomerase-like protein (cupin superfamily)
MTSMRRYIYSVSAWPSHVGAGISCYDYGPLHHESLEILYVDVRQGHDTFQISEKVTRLYYIVSGSGYFTIDNERYEIREGMVVEVPPMVEYSYSGNMKLIIFSTPRWFRGNDRSTRWNPDVNDRLVTRPLFRFARWMANLKFMGKSPVRGFVRLNRRLWKALPAGVTGLRPLHSYVHFMMRSTQTDI